MEHPGLKMAGALFFIAAAQLILSITVAEALYPGYSISGNYISDLGTGPSALIFNSSIFLFGLLVATGTYSMKSVPCFKAINAFFFLMAVGAMGVGVFNQDFAYIHSVFAILAFLCGGLTALASARVLDKPFSMISIAMGAMTLGALALFSAGIVTSGSMTSDIAYDSFFYMGLGPGGMERMILYPAVIWLAGFSIFLASRHGRYA
jgi:hypothetical membrane protein